MYSFREKDLYSTGLWIQTDTYMLNISYCKIRYYRNSLSIKEEIWIFHNQNSFDARNEKKRKKIYLSNQHAWTYATPNARHSRTGTPLPLLIRIQTPCQNKLIRKHTLILHTTTDFIVIVIRNDKPENPHHEDSSTFLEKKIEQRVKN